MVSQIERLQELLDERGRSPYWLAERLSVSKQTVYNWLAGRRPQNREALAQAIVILEAEPVLNRPAKGKVPPELVDILLAVHRDEQGVDGKHADAAGRMLRLLATGCGVWPSDLDETAQKGLLTTCEAVLHQLECGEAAEGDLRDIQWCARELRETLIMVGALPRPCASEEGS
jgi:transcriptional regulator with XRE-family HTH domain